MKYFESLIYCIWRWYVHSFKKVCLSKKRRQKGLSQCIHSPIQTSLFFAFFRASIFLQVLRFWCTYFLQIMNELWKVRAKYSRMLWQSNAKDINLLKQEMKRKTYFDTVLIRKLNFGFLCAISISNFDKILNRISDTFPFEIRWYDKNVWTSL